jgi:hypothetical protein
MPEIQDTELSQYVPGFVANLNLQPQQAATRLLSGVDSDLSYAEPGQMFNADDVGTSDPEDVNTRVPDTPDKFIGQARRVGFFSGYHDSCWFDSADKVREITDPTNTKMRALMAGRWRKVDDCIIAAAFGAANVITAPNTAPSTVAFPTGSQTIAANDVTYAHDDEVVPTDASDYGLSIGKLIHAGLILEASELDGDMYLALSAKQKADLLRRTPATNQFYSDVKALVAGTLTNFLGFNILRSERLLKTGNNRRVIAWKKPALVYRGRSIDGGNASIHIRNDKARTPQAYYRTEHGCLRRYDTGVVEILCKEV